MFRKVEWGQGREALYSEFLCLEDGGGGVAETRSLCNKV